METIPAMILTLNSCDGYVVTLNNRNRFWTWQEERTQSVETLIIMFQVLAIETAGCTQTSTRSLWAIAVGKFYYGMKGLTVQDTLKQLWQKTSRKILQKVQNQTNQKKKKKKKKIARDHALNPLTNTPILCLLLV
eukprot:TRINITY_DN24332_c0_g1_i1.p1 TRINITY_DN24332_c0_g1~~TRINITY_DN24332_c0_g1_i1.p1  ORF type:complete len:135 (-),score=3.67 TRINITY_DN24332_c0_g1_i1:8-412(-)